MTIRFKIEHAAQLIYVMKNRDGQALLAAMRTLTSLQLTDAEMAEAVAIAAVWKNWIEGEGIA